MNAELKLGQLITGEAERDAIHIAVVPLLAGEYLYCGRKVRLKYGTADVGLNGEYNDDAIGIVDPFLDGSVREGERFWCFLFPGTVVGMRHHWRHPAFDSVPVIAGEHEQWLRDFCDRWNFDFNELIEAGTDAEGDRYVIARGRDLHCAGELGTDHELFWQHLEAYVGRRFDDAHREGMVWSCTC